MRPAATEAELSSIRLSRTGRPIGGTFDSRQRMCHEHYGVDLVGDPERARALGKSLKISV